MTYRGVNALGKPAAPRRPAGAAHAPRLGVAGTGSEVSRGHLFQNHVVERMVGTSFFSRVFSCSSALVPLLWTPFIGIEQHPGLALGGR